MNEGEEIADYPLLQNLRNENKLPVNFWVFVPNPDKVSKSKNYAARFNVGSDWASLDCGGDPAYRDASLGVFLIRRKR